MNALNRQTTKVFFELVQAGLWEKEVRLSQYGCIDFNEILRLSEEQSVVGLVSAGLEHVTDMKIPQEVALQFVGQTLQLEQRNKAMNCFIEDVIEKMRRAGIYTLIVKGQGIAQCYKRPLWRSSGDIDFFLSEENFLKARNFFTPMVSDGFDPSNEDARNISAKVASWDIELHTNQYCGLSKRMDNVIQEVQNSVIFGGEVRSWMCGGTQVFLPSVNCDVIFVFTHFLKHFYKGGLGIRQICDWCRLLWTYKDTLNIGLLESRIRRMGLMTEWKAFGAFAVDYLGMPIDSMPFYSLQKKWSRKANGICSFILEVGNMGHSRDLRFYGNKSFIRRKIGAFGVRVGDLFRHTRLFPLDSIRFFPSIFFNGVRSAIKGVG